MPYFTYGAYFTLFDGEPSPTLVAVTLSMVVENAKQHNIKNPKFTIRTNQPLFDSETGDLITYVTYIGWKGKRVVGNDYVTRSSNR